MPNEDLVFLPLGGSGEIGMNLNVYGFGPEHARKWLIIDCGVMFGDLSTPGIDLICPDISFLLENRADIVGMILTHGHEDHIGATALLAPQLECPLYATAFTAGLIRRKFAERGEKSDQLHVVEMGAKVELSPFALELVTLTHSIPEPNGVIIETPLGRVLHTGDWKIDRSPTLGPLTDQNRLIELGDAGLLAMVCDSTNVLSEGESGSEKMVRENLIRVIGEQTGRVAITTFASNVGRVVSVCEAAAVNDRHVCLLGRSMLRIVEVAREAGLFPETISFVDPEEAGFLPRRHVLYLCTGSQGEPRAALARIARDDHRDLVLNEGDTVIFSSKIIPGNEREIFNLQNELVNLGVRIITEKDEPIHVSGHPCRDELRMMYDWARPQKAVPVHGEARHLEEHAIFAREIGVGESIAPRNGDLIRLAPGALRKIDEVPSGRMNLDGEVLLPEGSKPIRQRRKLSWAGICVVSIVLNRNTTLAASPEVIVCGTLAEGDDDENIAEEISEEVEITIKDLAAKSRQDDAVVTTAVKRAVRDVMTDFWGKRPIVETIIHRV